MKLTTRMHPLHAPLKCLECGKVIEIGEQYLAKNVYTYHVGCVRDKMMPYDLGNRDTERGKS